MDATEFCALEPDSIAKLLSSRQKSIRPSNWHGRRNAPRWPFPSTVELWVPDAHGEDHYSLATSINLSTTGIGLKLDEPIPAGTSLAIAVHEPEMSFHGRAVVRHCTETNHGFSIAGLQFLFDEPSKGKSTGRVPPPS
jgi:hypothetical protein